jgi:hypothetical protein
MAAAAQPGAGHRPTPLASMTSGRTTRAAIDRHFADRNAFFRTNPKRAGRKIWGQENTPSEFSPSNNCKDRHRCFFGI